MLIRHWTLSSPIQFILCHSSKIKYNRVHDWCLIRLYKDQFTSPCPWTSSPCPRAIPVLEFHTEWKRLHWVPPHSYTSQQLHEYIGHSLTSHLVKNLQNCTRPIILLRYYINCHCIFFVIKKQAPYHIPFAYKVSNWKFQIQAFCTSAKHTARLRQLGRNFSWGQKLLVGSLRAVIPCPFLLAMCLGSAEIVCLAPY